MTVAVARSSSASRGPGGLPAGSLGMFSLSSEHIDRAAARQGGPAAQGRQKRASAMSLNCCSPPPLDAVDESPLAQREQQAALGAQLELLETAIAPLLKPRGPFSSRVSRRAFWGTSEHDCRAVAGGPVLDICRNVPPKSLSLGLLATRPSTH